MGGYIGVTAGIIQLIGYAVYNLHLWKSQNSANAASWAIWTFGSILNFWLYCGLSHDWAKEALPLLCSIGCIGTFVHLWIKNGFGKPSPFDWWILGIDFAIVTYWTFSSGDEASLLYQGSTIISFIPMIRGLLNKEDYENPWAWAIWSIAYELMIITVMFRFEKWQDWFYPAVCLVLHFTVAIIACVTPPQSKVEK